MRYLVIILALLLCSCESPRATATKKTVEPKKSTVPSKPTPSSKSYTFQGDRWRKAKTDPKVSIALDNAVDRYKRNQARYLKLEKARTNGVPAPVIFGFHGRESSWDFTKSLAQGDSLQHKSVNVPAGRIPGVNPPYSFEQAALDALYDYEGLQKRNWTDLDQAMQNMESYNGLGYQKKGLPSPYLWAGTNIYSRGKYVADGRFDSMAVDKQLGVAAILKRMEERGMALPFK